MSKHDATLRTPAEALGEFASKCARWSAHAARAAAQAKQRGETDAAPYTQGQADAFEMAAVSAKARAGMLGSLPGALKLAPEVES